jgi:signal transduction histidine kinase
VVFVAALALRFWLVNDASTVDGRGRIWIEGPTLAVAFGLSLAMLLRVRRRGVSALFLDLSVVLDASIACFTLLPGVICPWPGYSGLLRTPDIAIVPSLCLSAGLRMSVRSALIGSLANAICFAGLLLLDRYRNAASFAATHETMLYALYFGSASLLGVSLAARARTLATAAAAYAERAERAHSGLARILQDNHDVGSLLSSARINADIVARAQPDEVDDDDGVQQASRALLSDLRELAELAAGSRDQAYVELASMEQLEAVRLADALPLALAMASRRFATVNFQLASELEAQARVQVAGGARGLERLLLNLLVNAAEGDGQRGASRVVLRATAAATHVEIAIEDDGPGFSVRDLEELPERLATTKSAGTGLGLMLVKRIVQASNGELDIRNAERGAQVRVRLPWPPRDASGG